MSKSIRSFNLLTSMLTLLLLVFTACNTNPAAQQNSIPTKAAASPVASQPTATAAAKSQAATPTGGAAAASPTAQPTTVLTTTTGMTSTVEAKTTPAAAKPTTALTTTTGMTPTVEAKATPTSAPTKVMTTTAQSVTTPAAPKATPASLKPAAPAEFTAKMTSNNTLGEILTDAQGMTLYTFKNDKPNQSMCNDACAKTWPPVLVKDEEARLTPPAGLPGKFGVIERQDGSYQVAYNEMPLYRYADDTKAGDAKGENVNQLWHVVTVPQGAAKSAAPAGATTWTVLVGAEGAAQPQAAAMASPWQFMRFYPASLTINVGDTIVWKQNSAEPHTVTFLKAGQKTPDLVIPDPGKSQQMMFNPLVIMPQGQTTFDGTALTGSGQMGGEAQFPKEYKLTFTKPGVYEYICAFHPMMKGAIIVQAAGKPYPKTPAQIEAEAKTQIEADTQAALKIKPEAAQATTRPGSGGATIHTVKIGYGDGILTWMGFSPAQLTIKAGDTVEWTQADTETPHTVTFTSGAKEPEMVLAEKQTAGPPKLILNPEVLAPAGKTTYSGKGYFNSGFIWGVKDPTPGPRTYSLTFDTPGTYKYICTLHDMMGMQGVIIVQPKTAK